MPRYIDANKIVVDAIQERKFVIQMQEMRNFETTIQTVYADLADFIAAQPTADVAEVKHGTWLLEREPNGKPYCFHCSVCDSDFKHIFITSAFDYCPNCGAKMDGGTNEKQ